MSLWDGLPISEPLQFVVWIVGSYGLFSILYLATKRGSLAKEEKFTIYFGILLFALANTMFIFLVLMLMSVKNSDFEFNITRILILLSFISPWIIGTTALFLLIYLKINRSQASHRAKTITRNALLFLSGVNFIVTALALLMAYAFSFADFK